MMVRIIDRSYEIDERDVREAILAWLKAKDVPCPKYTGNTDTTTWSGPGKVTIRWTEETNE